MTSYFLPRKVFYWSSLLFLFFSCKNSLDEVTLVTIHDNEPSESSKDVELIYSDSAKITFILKAPVLDRYFDDPENPYTEFIEGAEMEFYNKEGKIDSKITCKYAIHYEKEEKMDARKDVVVVNKMGETLNTEHLWWEKKTGMIYSDEFVKITTEDEIIYGDGLEANEDFTKYKILNIKGTISTDEEI